MRSHSFPSFVTLSAWLAAQGALGAGSSSSSSSSSYYGTTSYLTTTGGSAVWVTSTLTRCTEDQGVKFPTHKPDYPGAVDTESYSGFPTKKPEYPEEHDTVSYTGFPTHKPDYSSVYDTQSYSGFPTQKPDYPSEVDTHSYSGFPTTKPEYPSSVDTHSYSGFPTSKPDYPSSQDAHSSSEHTSYPFPTTTYPSGTGKPSSTHPHPSSSPSSASCNDYWLAKIKKQGVAPYAGRGYKVFRNVKDYGAKGDGVTDDTAAINRAITEGQRCNPETCQSTTTTPALVYLPPGTYIVSAPLIDYYLTNIIGNPDCLPVLKASANFQGNWVIDGSLNHIWISTNIFWRQVRNLVIDLTAVPGKIAGIHWPTGQATTLQNIVFKMSTAAGNQHQGLFIEDGSGGFVTDLVFYGGAQGLAVGNQQFTMRNLTFHNCGTAIQQAWDWGWTYKGISINNCQVGLDISAVNDAGALNVGSVVFIDSSVSNTAVFVKTGKSASSNPPTANSLILENIRLRAVPVAVQGPSGTLLAGPASGQSTIAAWGQGHAYHQGGRAPDLTGANLTPNKRPSSLTSGTDFYERSKPQYEKVPVTQFLSARDAGAKGDGSTDDTAALNNAIAAATAANKILFLDYGVYVVRGTIKIPAGARITGETLPIILSEGAFFNDINAPKPVVQVGIPGARGSVELSDFVVSTRGQQKGAVLIEYNLASPGTPSGLWDVHTRVGGFAGSNQQLANCPKTPQTAAPPVNEACIVAFLSFHITASASNVYVENCWFWVADHDIEDPALTQITLYAGRGLLVESGAGRVWLIGTAVEHHVLYEYALVGTRDVVLGQIQTETAYYQANPDARVPFPANAAYHDPVIAAGESGWGVRVVDSVDVLVYGAGLYSFFDNYDVTCSNAGNASKCQSHIFSVDRSRVSVYNLNTVGTASMITVGNSEVASWADNQDGFVSTIALFRSIVV